MPVYFGLFMNEHHMKKYLKLTMTIETDHTKSQKKKATV